MRAFLIGKQNEAQISASFDFKVAKKSMVSRSVMIGEKALTSKHMADIW
jgi:hypothetical protein